MQIVSWFRVFCLGFDLPVLIFAMSILKHFECFWQFSLRRLLVLMFYFRPKSVELIFLFPFHWKYVTSADLNVQALHPDLARGLRPRCDADVDGLSR